MRKIIILLLGVLYCSNLFSAPLDFLTKILPPKTPFDSTTTAFVNDYSSSSNSLDDSIVRDVPLGFSFPFGGSNFNKINIVSNGFLRFTTSNLTYYANNTLESIDASMPHAIFPYWDDLNPGTGGNITYGTFGSAPNRHFAVTWTNVPHYSVSGQYTFQAVLYEDGAIRFRYNSASDANGSSNGGATIGVIENNTKFDQHSYNATIDSTKDIFYYRPTNLSLKKTSCVIRDPANLTVNPKRIPGATIRYAIEISNSGIGRASNALVDDSIPATLDVTTIRNLQIKSGACNCLGVVSGSSNPAPGTGNAVHPIKLNFGSVEGGSVATPTKECGYFEVDIK